MANGEQWVGDVAGEIASWKAQLGEFSLHHEVEGLGSEVAELNEAYDRFDWTTEAMRNLGLESADVIVRALGIIGSLHLDPEELLREVVAKAQMKYDADTIRRLMADDGYSLEDAMHVLKCRYEDRTRPQAPTNQFPR